MDYDEFEYQMQQAGWSLDKIEKAWQRGEADKAYYSHYDADGCPHELEDDDALEVSLERPGALSNLPHDA